MKNYVENGTFCISHFKKQAAYTHGFDFSFQQGGYPYLSWMKLEKSQEFKGFN